ncbi:MAG: hypothetical protein ACYSW3_02100 [Planctomycetota bacterium]
MRQIPGYDIHKYSDPYTYAPMGQVDLRVGEQVCIHDMNGSGNNLEWWVIKELPNEHGFDYPWFLIGTQHQIEMF